MRLFLLPISTRRALIYCEPAAHIPTQPGDSPSYIDRGVNYASKKWAEWEKGKGWQLKFTQYGNAFLRRIPFEEWGLKSIPALKEVRKKNLEALLLQHGGATAGNNKGARESLRGEMAEVKFPGVFQALGHKSVLQTVKDMATTRQDLHRRRLYWSLGIMPFTAPFALIPVIPNIPFLYLLFRAFSHWRALGGSQHLDFLVKNNLLNLSPSKQLDSLYTTGLLHATQEEGRTAPEPSETQSKQVTDLIRRQLANTSSPAVSSEKASIGDSSSTSSTTEVPPILTSQGETKLSSEAVTAPPEPEEIMLLRAWNGKLMAERLGLPGLEIEIERAVEQVEKDLKKRKESAAANAGATPASSSSTASASSTSEKKL